MAEDVALSPDGSHIIVRSSGPPSLDEMTRTLSAIAELRDRCQVYNVLVDSSRRTGQPSGLDIFRGGQMLVDKLGPKIRVAVVVSDYTDDHRLFENVAVNRGATVAFFNDAKTALAWLSKRHSR